MGETKEKKLKAKTVHKHETAANWELSNYIPAIGEIVFYDPDEEYDYTRQKNGDGVHKVSELLFANQQIIVDSELSETSENPVQNKVITQKFIDIESSINGVEEELQMINEGGVE